MGTASIICSQYPSQVNFYIDEAHASGMRHLVVVDENREPGFLAGIPDEREVQNFQDFNFWPMKSPNSPYPAWKVPARAYQQFEVDDALCADGKKYDLKFDPQMKLKRKNLD